MKTVKTHGTNQKEHKRKNRCDVRIKAVYTVELALLMPLILAVFLLPIRIGLQLHDEVSQIVLEQWDEEFNPVKVFYGKELIQGLIE
ncbi:MAG: TadE family protein [Lachnospiraceae bacterium]